MQRSACARYYFCRSDLFRSFPSAGSHVAVHESRRIILRAEQYSLEEINQRARARALAQYFALVGCGRDVISARCIPRAATTG